MIKILRNKQGRGREDNRSNISSASPAPVLVRDEEEVKKLRQLIAYRNFMRNQGLKQKGPTARPFSARSQDIKHLFAPTGYGMLYNFAAMEHANFPIVGTRMPRVTDFLDLAKPLGGAGKAGFYLKSILTGTSIPHPRWTPENLAGDKNILFNAFPAGRRIRNGTYENFGTHCYLGTDNKDNLSSCVHDMILVNVEREAAIKLIWNGMDPDTTHHGFSVRLVIDNLSPLYNQWYEGMYIKDIDGNKYGLIKIGRLIWTASNYMTTQLNDGTPIDLLDDDTAWEEAAGPARAYPKGEGQYVGLSSNL